MKMELRNYTAEAVAEANHWWFVGRRFLFSNIIKSCGLPDIAEILDIGTGTGTNLRMLSDLGFTRVTGLDQSPEAIRYCAQKGFGKVELADICTLPFPNCSFDLILATDIIEHVEDDGLALCEIRRVLKPNGYLLLTVPTFQFLWGLQDDVSHHKRRYCLSTLLSRIRDAGLVTKRHFYFNYLLFVPIFLARGVIRLFHIELASEHKINTKWLNCILGFFFASM
jgi:SAM-dependent methyltransferase